MRGWLCLEKSHGTYVAAREGYPDKIGQYYSWDDRVANALRLQSGDYLALWDGTELLGISVIESIEVGSSVKRIARCPVCTSTDVRLRKRASSAYKCGKCKEEFSEAVFEVTAVRTFTADYAAGWTTVSGIGAHACRALAESVKSQLSMRALNMEKFRSLQAGLPITDQHILAKRATPIPGGHRSAVVRTRVGQSAFRSLLLGQFGANCIFTGASPERALQAAHLYRYSDLGKHEDEGGLLMRADLHLLFDDGLLLIEPASRRIHLAPAISGFSQYKGLHGRALASKLGARCWEWLRLHWEQYAPSR